jgi:RNA polymerase sigma factor (sigma-70 family)
VRLLYVGPPAKEGGEVGSGLRTLASAGFVLEDVGSTRRLDELVAAAAADGWVHILGESDESPGDLVNRAIRQPGLIPIVIGTVEGVAREFAALLRRSEVEMFVILDGFDDVEGQLRRQLPVRFVRQWSIRELRAAIEPLLGGLRPKDRESVEWLLDRRPIVKGGKCIDEQLPRARRDGLDELLRRHGLRSPFAFRNTLLVMLYLIYRRCCGFSHAEATKLCGLSDPRSMEAKVLEVLRVRSLAEALELTTEEASSRAIASLAAGGGQRIDVHPIELTEVLNRLLRPEVEDACTQDPGAAEQEGRWCSDAMAKWLNSEYGSTVRGKLSSRVSGADNVDDLAEDVLERLAKKVPGLAADNGVTERELSSAGSVIADLVHDECQNEIANERKKRKKHKVRHGKLERETRIRATDLEESMDPHQILVLAERRRQIESIIDGLPEPFREVSIQRFIEQRKVAAIASRLGISKRTVDTLCRQSLEMLRVMLRRIARELREA